MIDSPPPELVRFAEELHRHRRRCGMTLGALGAATRVSLSLVQKIEKARRWPSADFARRCDLMLGTGQLFAAMMPSIDGVRVAQDRRHRARRPPRPTTNPAAGGQPAHTKPLADIGVVLP